MSRIVDKLTKNGGKFHHVAHLYNNIQIQRLPDIPDDCPDADIPLGLSPDNGNVAGHKPAAHPDGNNHGKGRPDIPIHHPIPEKALDENTNPPHKK